MILKGDCGGERNHDRNFAFCLLSRPDGRGSWKRINRKGRNREREGSGETPRGDGESCSHKSKGLNNEPLQVSKKEKHKVQEAKCSASGHISLCRMQGNCF